MPIKRRTSGSPKRGPAPASTRRKAPKAGAPSGASVGLGSSPPPARPEALRLPSARPEALEGRAGAEAPTTDAADAASGSPERPEAALDPATAVTVARILAPQGLRGEVKVESLTDFPQRFEAGAALWLRGAPVEIESFRTQGRALVLKLAGTDDRTAAEALRGEELLAPAYEDLEPGRYYLDDLIGLSAVDEAGGVLGEVVDIFPTGSNDVFVVRGAQGDLLLPAIEGIIREIDVAARRMVVYVVEGLEWEKAAWHRRRSSAARRPPQTPTAASDS